MAFATWRDRFRDWSPRAHQDVSVQQHITRMWGIGEHGSKIMYFNPVVSILSGVCIWGFVIMAMAMQTELEEAMSDGQGWVTDIWNWLYMLSQNIWVVIVT